MRSENFHGKLSFHYTLKCRFLSLSHSLVPPAPTVPVVTSVLMQSSSGFACHINRTNVFDTLAICKFFSDRRGGYYAQDAKEGSRESWTEEERNIYVFFFGKYLLGFLLLLYGLQSCGIWKLYTNELHPKRNSPAVYNFGLITEIKQKCRRLQTRCPP